jgi:hypothetical protein
MIDGDETTDWFLGYSGLKITERLGNVTLRVEKRWKEQGGSGMANSMSEHV